MSNKKGKVTIIGSRRKEIEQELNLLKMEREYMLGVLFDAMSVEDEESKVKSKKRLHEICDEIDALEDEL